MSGNINTSTLLTSKSGLQISSGGSIRFGDNTVQTTAYTGSSSTLTPSFINITTSSPNFNTGIKNYYGVGAILQKGYLYKNNQILNLGTVISTYTPEYTNYYPVGFTFRYTILLFRGTSQYSLKTGTCYKILYNGNTVNVPVTTTTGNALFSGEIYITQNSTTSYTIFQNTQGNDSAYVTCKSTIELINTNNNTISNIAAEKNGNYYLVN